MDAQVIELLKQIVAILGSILGVLTSIYGIMAMIVKYVKTLPEGNKFLPVVKAMGRLTNNQTNNTAVRAMQLLKK